MDNPTSQAVYAPVVYPSQTDIYGFPVGTTGTFIPESLIYPDDKKSDRVTKYNPYKEDDGMMLVPEEVIPVHCAPSVISEGPFESQLPEMVDHYVVEDCCDPAWQYNMKSYIRGQQHVNGYTHPVVYKPYESHIDELGLPAADYDDRGPYERRLPVAGDPKMLNRNFIIRQSEDYRRRL